MIQRKQSLWLLLVALLNAGVFYFDVYHYHNIVNGLDTTGVLRVGDHYPSLIIAVVITLLPLVTIFMFRNRKQQMRMIAYNLVAESTFVAMLLTRVTRLEKLTPPPTSGTYWIGAILPIVAIIFLIMAMIGVRKDDKLVKSVDRLR
ncbi:MAG: hypothetical protein JWQ38_3257 [Flavipsychrobacter sp.]|nr:hypothetical protein [Flavipsychrobacter sp.]